MPYPQLGRRVRETVERLSRQVHLPVRPYDDPASPALALWLAEGITHEGHLPFWLGVVYFSGSLIANEAIVILLTYLDTRTRRRVIELS